MTFKGDTIITRPTLAMVEIYIAEKGLFCEAKDCYEYWENKNWLTAKHVEVKTLESAVNTYNGIVTHRALKKKAKELGITKLRKKDKKREFTRLKKEFSSGNITLDNFVVVGEKKNKKTKDENYIPYDEQLKDNRWHAFRKFVLTVRGKKCEMCGSRKILQVHHPKYIYGRKAWEYTCNEVMVLCKECHEKVHNIK